MKRLLVLSFFTATLFAQSKVTTTYHNDPALAAKIVDSPACEKTHSHSWTVRCLVPLQITQANKRMLKLKALIIWDNGDPTVLHPVFEHITDDKGNPIDPFEVNKTLENIRFHVLEHLDSKSRQCEIASVHVEVEEVR